MPGLQKQSVSVSFAQGVDTKTDPFQVIQGKLLTLENGIFINPQRITKRNGYANIGLAGSVGIGLTTFNDELLAFDGDLIRSYSDATDGFVSRGYARSLDLSTAAVTSNSYAQTSQDGCYHPAGLKVFCWEDSRGGSRYCVVDATTGLQVVSDAVLDAAGLTPRAFAIGNYVVMIYYNGSNGLSYKKLSVASPTSLSAAVALCTNIKTATPIWDGVVIGQRLFLAWYSTNATNSLTMAYLTSTLVMSSQVHTASESPSTSLTLWGDTYENVWCAYYNGTAIKGIVMDYSLTSVVAVTSYVTVSNVRNLTGIMTSETSASVGVATLFYEVTNATTYNYLTRSVTLSRSSGTVTPGSPADFLRSVGLASKAFKQGSTVYVGLAYESTLQTTYFLATSAGVIHGKIAPGIGGGLPKKAMLPQAWTISTQEFLLALLDKAALSVQSGSAFTTTGVIDASIKFGQPNIYMRATMGNNLHITGGVLSMYDGVGIVEHGFHLFPEALTAPGGGALATSATGGSIAAGDYYYCAVYEWVDNQGNIHRSAPSVPQKITHSGSTSSCPMVCPTLRLTSKCAAFSRSEVSVAIYRTAANGSIFFRITSLTSPLMNVPTADATATFTDTYADSSIIGNEILYTTGGVLENIPPPACYLIGTFKDRVIIVPNDDKISFWVSKGVPSGGPVEFSDAFVRKIDARDGDILGIHQMDDKLIFFKQNTSWAAAGEGPDDTGTTDSLSKPELINTDAGCINGRSIVMTPNGLMRQTKKGIYLLNRSLQDSYIGAPVEAYNNETITKAILVPNTNQVRFTTESGVCLVYDYLFDQWSVFTNHKALDATVFGNLFTWIDEDGNVYQETVGSYTDAGDFIKLKLLTSWLSFAGLQGFQRVYQALLLGQYKTKHRLIMTAAYDFNANPSQQTYIDAGTDLAVTHYGDDDTYGSGSPYGGSYPLYQFRLFLNRQKCQSVQLGIEEVQDGEDEYGEGFSLSALNFLVGFKAGTYKVPPARSYS